MSKKQCTLLLIYTCFLLGRSFAVNAQIPSPDAAISLPSPNAASLGQYGETPVSFFTGIPNIEVPLYTLKDGKFTLPIGLEYYAAGFKPDVHPGWVGMGWNLSVAGTISRVINDEPDESNYTSSVIAYGANNGYWFNHSILDVNNWNNKSYIQNIARDNNKVARDTEPDEFSFNFLGYSGKFYLTEKGLWQVKCDKAVAVEVINSNSPFADVPSRLAAPRRSIAYDIGYIQTFRGFTITTEDGNKYVFGDNNNRNAIEYSMNFFGQNGASWLASSWNLTKIINPTGEEINFIYERDDFINQMNISIYNIIRSQPSTGGPCGNTSQQLTADSYSGSLVSPVYLSSIQSTNSTIYFDRSTSRELVYPLSAYNEFVFKFNSYYQTSYGITNDLTFAFPFLQAPNYVRYPDCIAELKWKKLDKIRVVSKGRELRKFDLRYSSNDLQRLTLNSVTEMSSDNVPKNPHVFTYNDIAMLPPYLANKNDHWGFFNDVFASVNNYNNYYSLRNPTALNSTAIKGMLTRIVYPTGGITDFDYEENIYDHELNEDRSQVVSRSNPRAEGGGVRIRKISSYTSDDPNNKIVKEYFYVKGYNNTKNPEFLPSSGVLGGKSRYYFSNFTASIINYTNTYYLDVFSSLSVLPSSYNSQGTHIGYSEVVEKNGDGSYTIYYYSNFDTGNLDEITSTQNMLQPERSVYSPYTSTEQERGKLLKEVNFSNLGNRVKAHLTTFTAKNKNGEYVRAVHAKTTLVCDFGQYIAEEGSPYGFYTYSYLPETETDSLYDDSNDRTKAISTTKVYSYNNDKLTTSISTYDSQGKNIIDTYSYPDDYSYSNSSDAVISSMALMRKQSKHILNCPIEIITYRDGKIINSVVNTYKVFGSNNGNIHNYQTFGLETTRPLDPATEYTKVSFTATSPTRDTKLVPKVTAQSYDTRGNLLEEEGSGKDITSYLWGYDQTLVVAKIKNANPYEIFHDDFEPSSGWDAGLSFDNTKSHTGKTSATMNALWSGAISHSFASSSAAASLTSPRKYVLSGWVYTTGPTAQIWLFKNRPADISNSSINYYADQNAQSISTEQTGRWIYLEKEITVPADVTLLTVRLTTWCHGTNLPGQAWFDNIRLYPADAQMITYTHDPLIGTTSISDVNSRPTYYEYDQLQRLKIIRDDLGNIRKHYEYHYQK